jgi:hypothetical protein
MIFLIHCKYNIYIYIWLKGFREKEVKNTISGIKQKERELKGVETKEELIVRRNQEGKLPE